MQANIDFFSKLGDFLTMADGSFLGSRFLTAYRLQFSLGNLFRKWRMFTSDESQPFQDEMTDECDTEYRIQFSQQQ